MAEPIRASGRSVSSLFVYMLIGMFALFSLLLVLIGAGAYQGIVRDEEHTAQVRTSLSYIASKVRAGDATGAVFVEEYQGTSVLALRQDAESAITRIYCLPGDQDVEPGLYELFTDAEEEPNLEDGQRIADVTAFEARQVDGGIEIGVTTAMGDAQRMRLRLRSAQ